MSPIAPPLILFCLLATDEKPAPKWPVGKETTYFTGPLDSEGYVDYVAALNNQLRKGITPDANANVLIWKAIGPTPESKKMPGEYFKWLGIEEPPPQGDYLINLWVFGKDRLNLDKNASDALTEQLERAIKKSWTAKDFPHIASWLTANEKPLATVIEATKRLEYYNPLAPPRDADGRCSLLDARLDNVQICCVVGKALAARAMLLVGKAKFDEAWQDLLALHRLGRHIGQGGALIEALVGLSLERIACDADAAYLERANLDATQLSDRLQELQSLKPIPSIVEKVDVFDRCMLLDIIQSLQRDRDKRPR